MSRIYVSKKLHMKTEDTPDIPTPTSFVSTADPLSISSHGNEIITPDNLNNHNFETAIVKEEPCDESQDGFSLSNKIDYASPKLPKKKKLSPKNPVDPKRKFPCPIFGCTKSYGKSSHLRSHLTWHTGIKPFVCEIEECGKSFTRSDELARHMRTHTGEKPFECLQCFKKFSRSDHLTKHIATHNRQISGECECKRKKTVKPGGTSVQTPAKAKRTIPIVVKNEFEEMPSLDGTLKEEEQPQSVKEIADTHLIKEEQADDINSENESNEIKKNIKEELILPDEHNHLGTTPACNDNGTEMLASKLGKPFQCHFHCCSKAFSRSDDLNRHIRTHTGEKPYACEECNKRFIRSDHLKKHIKTHCKKIFRARLRNN